MKDQSLKLWQEFRRSFIFHLKNTPQEKYYGMLDQTTNVSIKKNRTNFYSNYFIDKIALDLELEKEKKEFLKIDISLVQRSVNFGWPVRKIFIEVENDLDGDPEREVQKLCSVYAPLKILIVWTWNSWDTIRQDHLVDNWSYILNSYHDVFVDLAGTFIVIIAETNFNSNTKKIRFLATSWNETQKTFDAEEVLFERTF
ncbi:hypothetical protein GCM10023093_28250 [Nemorincola caseinilytica]|uniref:Uncharacterized protein n=1 Tax=Nemorincola caseinilytica TaxID=2054315 RepID=A0ABP8NQ22_9BACT